MKRTLCARTPHTLLSSASMITKQGQNHQTFVNWLKKSTSRDWNGTGWSGKLPRRRRPDYRKKLAGRRSSKHHSSTETSGSASTVHSSTWWMSPRKRARPVKFAAKRMTRWENWSQRINLHLSCSSWVGKKQKGTRERPPWMKYTKTKKSYTHYLDGLTWAYCSFQTAGVMAKAMEVSLG